MSRPFLSFSSSRHLFSDIHYRRIKQDGIISPYYTFPAGVTFLNRPPSV